MSEVKNKGGRPGLWDKWISEDGLILLEAWARNGLTDKDIAHNIGISTTTLYDWKNKFPEIVNALKRGKEVVDVLVENALLKRALGYRYEEVTKELTENGLEVTKVVEKEEKADNVSLIFWLKNRNPEMWRDVKRIESENKHTVSNPLEELSADELRKLIEVNKEDNDNV